jgi:hypothetical protein
MKNITKKEIKIFLLRMLTMSLIELAFGWDDAVRGFRDGLNGLPFRHVSN